MPDYISCPNCRIKFQPSAVKRKSDEVASERASSLPPAANWKRRCSGTDEWVEVVESLKKWKIYFERDVPARNRADYRGEKATVTDDGRDGPVDDAEHFLDANVVQEVVQEVVAECSKQIFGDESSDETAEISDPEESEEDDKTESVDDPSGEEIPEAREPAPREVFSEFVGHERELFAKLKKLPTIKGDGKLGSLVEGFQRKNPRVKITNLYDMSYIVDSVQGCKWEQGGCKFLIRWDGWSASTDSWEKESTIKQNATPYLCLHICEFFLNAPRIPEHLKEEYSWEYFCRFVEDGLLNTSKKPDYLTLSKLANEELMVQNDRILLPSVDDVVRMRQRIRTCLETKDFDGLFAKFGRRFESFVEFAVARVDARIHYQEWSERIASLEPKTEITVENFVDCDELPPDFVYITDYIVSDDVKIMPPTKFCACTETGCFGESCEGRHHRAEGRHHRADRKTSFPAYRGKRLHKACKFVPLYECNSKCSCGPSCTNRLVQNGPELKLTIFKTCNRGWGIMADQFIPEGAFIGEYIGELMTNEGALRRHHVNPAYLFDLMPYGGESEYTVDAAKFGNYTRFFNHSCNPNMRVSYVYVENHNPTAPRLAFFASRKINKGDELTFDYHMQTVGSGHLTPMICQCGAGSKCKRTLF